MTRLEIVMDVLFPWWVSQAMKSIVFIWCSAGEKRVGAHSLAEKINDPTPSPLESQNPCKCEFW